MEIHEPYIPKEYLALKINYIKQQLAELPEVSMTQRTIRNKKRPQSRYRDCGRNKRTIGYYKS